MHAYCRVSSGFQNWRHASSARTLPEGLRQQPLQACRWQLLSGLTISITWGILILLLPDTSPVQCYQFAGEWDDILVEVSALNRCVLSSRLGECFTSPGEEMWETSGSSWRHFCSPFCSFFLFSFLPLRPLLIFEESWKGFINRMPKGDGYWKCMPCWYCLLMKQTSLRTPYLSKMFPHRMLFMGKIW